jgi:hypothetical protein
MSSRWMSGSVLTVIVSCVGPSAMAESSPSTSSGSSGSSGGMRTARVPAAVGSGGWSQYPYPYYSTVSRNGVPIVIVPAVPVVVPTIVVPQQPAGGLGFGGNGIAGPLPPGGMPDARQRPAPPAKKAEPAKSNQLVKIGDRLFRVGNTRRAEERYEQAVRANPHAASPRVRLAQVALLRGRYAEAANHLREAQAAEPGWLAAATDIQSIYAEPGDFAKQIAKLESHLQTNPADRNAWLVLGAQLYLSGRTRQAADVFIRLSDRQPDATLAAFLDAARPVNERR